MSPTPSPPDVLGPAVERSVAPPDDGGDAPRVTVELGVRSLSPDAQPLLDRTVEGLERALERSTLDDYDVTVVGHCFDPTAVAAGTRTGRDIQTVISEVRDWAVREGASLDPYFRYEEVDCRLSDEQYTRVTFPTLFLAEYHDDDLSFVAPARIGGRVVDVLDRVEALENTSPRLETPIPE